MSEAWYRLVVLLFLLACTVGPGDAGAGRVRFDSSGTGFTDSGSDPRDTSPLFDPSLCGLPADVAPLTCTLSNPGPVDITTMDTLVADLDGLPTQFGLYGGVDWECSSDTDSRGWTTYAGDCTDADGNIWGGAAAWQWDAGIERWTFDELTEITLDGVGYWWDGTVDFRSWDEGSGAFPDVAYKVSGSTDPALPNGDFAVVGELYWMATWEYFDATITADGFDWCLEADVFYGYGECPNGTGWWQLVGDRSATLVEVGALDGCPCGCWDPSDAEPMAFCRESPTMAQKRPTRF